MSATTFALVGTVVTMRPASDSGIELAGVVVGVGVRVGVGVVVGVGVGVRVGVGADVVRLGVAVLADASAVGRGLAGLLAGADESVEGIGEGGGGFGEHATTATTAMIAASPRRPARAPTIPACPRPTWLHKARTPRTNWPVRCG